MIDAEGRRCGASGVGMMSSGPAELQRVGHAPLARGRCTLAARRARCTMRRSGTGGDGIDVLPATDLGRLGVTPWGRTGGLGGA